jgi:subtilisin family serine protease
MKHTMKCSIFFIAFLILNCQSMAQSKYWVLFRDKTNSSSVITTSIIDCPINNSYIQLLEKQNIRAIQKSKWLNAISAYLTDSQKNQVATFDFVKEVVLIDGRFHIATLRHHQPQLAPVMAQIEANAFREAGLTGKGIKIGVIDAGFDEAPTNQQLKHLFETSAIIAKRDYVNPKHITNFYADSESFFDFHGSEVLTTIAGVDINSQQGLATDAQFYLARTDHGGRESRSEEDNWVAAVEWLDSLGVKLVNTSLGYTKGFTNPSENYTPSQMDGHTSLISKFADIAVNQKGMLLIVSAGNEGDDPTWRIISTPADAEGVITVGATNQKLWNKIGYSSIGPEFLTYNKPNVSCYSLYGTSLSAPVITGFAACLMQANPTLTNKEIRNIIEKSAHLYPYNNNYIGYGVPLASRAIGLLANPNALPVHSKEMMASGNKFIVAVNSKIDMVSVFHKKSKTLVIGQEAVRVKKGKLTLERQSNETRTTIDLKNEVIEIVW